ncbi:MAG: alanine--tRNA ligase [Pseudomonadota bacterium]
MPSLNQIRHEFIQYFAGQNHEVVQSAPLVPQADPSLLFVNAGMVPFKNIFTGLEARPYNRAVSSQKCVRAGGKHNDLENVGYTARHHTFFEMLGNFSFGDYFKDVAISYAWRFITENLALPKDKLLVTVYHEDEEAFSLWRKIAGLPENRIIRIATSDNFWSMGDTGPCGPCSEIFYDHGASIAGGPPGSPDEDGDRFIEIWNLVFMQFNRDVGGAMDPLPKPSIDTGMGLERLGAVLQGKHDNYDTDLFQALIAAAAQRAGVEPKRDALIAYRVIADHVRSTAFLIADGVTPSNEGRGYVLRRIMRRAMRYAHNVAPGERLLAHVAKTVCEQMGDAFPELGRAGPLIDATILREEEKFEGLLDRGLALLRAEVEKLGSKEPLPGAVAFKLYDTYGFPLDLTEDSMRREGRSVDIAGFDAAMEQQRTTARSAWSGSGAEADDTVWLEVLNQQGPTDFTGYSNDASESEIVSIVRDGAITDRAVQGDLVEVATRVTPFYGESGGQVGDRGVISGPSGAISVRDTQKRAGKLHVHIGEVSSGAVQAGDKVSLSIEAAMRSRTRANHSATHLLHKALRSRLGDHVVQKGSLVDAERLRFDFSHEAPVTEAQIAKIEADVNTVIRQNAPVETQVMAYTDAIDAGAVALFGEKYDDSVRVLSMGEALERGTAPYSVELCGGTHVERTGDIALFAIVAETGVSAGVRRIEALTGEAARIYLRERADSFRSAVDALKTTPSEFYARLESLIAERKTLEKNLSEAKRALALGGGAGEETAAETIGAFRFIGKVYEDVPTKDLRGISDQLLGKLGDDGVVALIGVNKGKAALTVNVTKSLTEKIDAVALARAGAQAVGGKGGGGRPDFAQAGGPDGEKANDAVAAIRDALSAAAQQ